MEEASFMKKIVLILLLMLFVLQIASAYPIGISPAPQTICVRGGDHTTVYFYFYSGATEKKTFNIYLQNLTWISLDNNTMLQSGEFDAEPNLTMPIAVYAVVSRSLADGLYRGTMEICTIAPENETIKVTYCLPALMIFNVTENCTQSVAEQNQSVVEQNSPAQQGNFTTTEVPGNGNIFKDYPWLSPILVILAAAAIIFCIRRLARIK